MTKPRIIFGLCLALLLLGGYISLRGSASHKDVVQKVFGNQQVFDAFAASREVAAQRLHQRREDGKPAILASYDHDQILSVATNQFQKLQHLLVLPSSYEWRRSNRCMPDYGVLFVFRAEPRTVRVALCFKCNSLAIFDGDDQSARRINSKTDFDPIRKELVAIAKSIYPDDSEIQKLK